MRKLRFILAVMFLFAMPVNLVAAENDAAVRGSFTNEDGTRPYEFFIPVKINKKAPLVVMLHGCTQNAQDFAAGTEMNQLAKKHGFFVLYPEQSADYNANKCWNWFEEISMLSAINSIYLVYSAFLNSFGNEKKA
ncbi:alpha/beta hydrolase family esterase [Bacillus sp. T33-2]|uniref:alpha/beta hydrolase family esterase n=1 Tax=Bacillus sp. T33-2 TaxID=2054168 RepID=UPI000C785F23|nr:PHB depolymerase family esterase [Bacillus sp. T33-2]PLR94463.1 hypothetical protein CVD19_17395 [Bacillus sp. T33-2]